VPRSRRQEINIRQKTRQLEEQSCSKEHGEETYLLTDPQGVEFLQWCLPRLHLRWAGFRKVRRQVYKRINRRLRELALTSIEAYRVYLEDHLDEWKTLESLCWIHISRFYRDRSVFQHVEHEILPQLAQGVIARGESELHCWSAGCAGGEEPYTLAIIWSQVLRTRFPELRLRIIATDIDREAIHRAERGCYGTSSVRDLPDDLRAQAFDVVADELCLKDQYRACVTFAVQDIRACAPEGLFDLILCRNLVFTYFDDIVQRNTLQTLIDKLAPSGVLIIGALESLPGGVWQIQPWLKRLGIYRKSCGK
jgi:chemotaxis protein methyltransferase CheR